MVWGRESSKQKEGWDGVGFPPQLRQGSWLRPPEGPGGDGRHSSTHDVLCESIFLHSLNLCTPSRALPSGSHQAGGGEAVPSGSSTPRSVNGELRHRGL